jgi:hypothetical protein
LIAGGDIDPLRKQVGEKLRDGDLLKQIDRSVRIAPMRIEIHQLHATLMTMDGELPPLSIER